MERGTGQQEVRSIEGGEPEDQDSGVSNRERHRREGRGTDADHLVLLREGPAVRKGQQGPEVESGAHLQSPEDPGHREQNQRAGGHEAPIGAVEQGHQRKELRDGSASGLLRDPEEGLGGPGKPAQIRLLG